MRRAGILSAIGVLLALLGISWGERLEAQPTFQSILVVVQVKDCSSGEPIAGARVTVVDTTQDDKILAQGTTDSEGKFSAVIFIIAFNVPDAVEKIDVLVEKEGYTLGTSVKVVMESPQGQFISVSVCLISAGSRTDQPVCSPSTSPTGPTVTLQPGRSIQEAIDQAAEGTVIQLQPGEYTLPTSLRITKGISLIGLGARPDPGDPTRTVPDPEAVVLRGNRSEPVVVIEAEAPVRIENVTVREGSGAGPEERGGGVHIANSSDVRLHCVILTENVRFGLVALLSVVNIEESQVLSTRPTTPGRDGQGLRLRGSTVQISKTVIRGNAAQGVLTRDFDEEHPSNVVVEESVIEENTFVGLMLLEGSRLEVRRSRIANNRPFEGQFGYGVWAMGWGQLVLEESAIEGHRPMADFARYGVLISSEIIATLRGNTIRENDWGVSIGDPQEDFEIVEAEFLNNTITQNDNCGLWIDEDPDIVIRGSGNTITDNGRGPNWNICGATDKVPEGF